MKKADMSIQLIVAVIIALIILAVILYIFVGKAKFFQGTLGDCNAMGGKCANDDGKCEGEAYKEYPTKIMSEGCPYKPDTDETKKYGQCCIP